MARGVQISAAEWSVMEPIWAAGQAAEAQEAVSDAAIDAAGDTAAGACTAADVIRALRATHDWNQSTIRTLLARLVEKGALAYEVDGARYLYRAAVTREQCVRQEGKSFLEKAFAGDVAALVAHFVSEAPLDQTQIEQLERLLAESKTAPRVKKGKQK